MAVTASAIVYDVFRDATAEEQLKKYCKSKNKDLALMAINYVLCAEDQEPYVSTIREVME